MSEVTITKEGPVTIVTINRPAHRNAVDRSTADGLAASFLAFESDPAQRVAILTGAGGFFCAGADLKGIASGNGNRLEDPTGEPLDGAAPMGPTRLRLTKPVIAAIEGPAVAGGLELALWCDLRVAAATAIFGVYCRRFGVPLIDGGTYRLPRLIGQSRALDMILTGRPVSADEALAMGLANRVVATGAALSEAITLAQDLAALPQTCLVNDRQSALAQWSLSEADALRFEFEKGRATLGSGEAATGAARFSGGAGRGGARTD